MLLKAEAFNNTDPLIAQFNIDFDHNFYRRGIVADRLTSARYRSLLVRASSPVRPSDHDAPATLGATD